MSISTFQSTMGNLARPNLFKVHIYTNGIKTPSVDFKQGLAIKCHTASIPGLDIASTDKDFSYRSYGYQKIYTDVSLSFYCSEEMRELQFLQDWMKKIIRPADNRVGYYSDYIGNIDIIKLDRQQEKTMTTHIYEAYPVNISSMDLGYGSNDEVMSVTSNFRFRYYTQEFGGKQEPVGVSSVDHYDNNQEEVDIDNITAEINPSNSLLKKGQAVRSGGSSLLDFRGAQ
jgi:hypothetical protein